MGGAARRARPQTGCDLRYDLRITFEEAVLGTEKEIEFPVLGRCDTCSGSGAKPGTAAGRLPAVQGPRRDPVASARRCSARWSAPAPARAAGARARSSRRRARRATARAAPSAAGRSGSRSPPGIDEGHQIRLSNEGEVGPRGGAPGSLYVAVHVRRPPGAHPRGHGALLRGRRSRSRRRRWARRIRVPTVEGDDARSRSSPARSRAPRSASAAGACRTSAAPSSRGDLHVIANVVVPTKLTKKQRELLEAFAKESGDAIAEHQGLREKLGLG